MRYCTIEFALYNGSKSRPRLAKLPRLSQYLPRHPPPFYLYTYCCQLQNENRTLESKPSFNNLARSYCAVRFQWYRYAFLKTMTINWDG
jgi:hypothetical protein